MVNSLHAERSHSLKNVAVLNSKKTSLSTDVFKGSALQTIYHYPKPHTIFPLIVHLTTIYIEIERKRFV